MQIIMDLSHIGTVPQMQDFLKSTDKAVLQTLSKKELYTYLRELLTSIKYRNLKKKINGL